MFILRGPSESYDFYVRESEVLTLEQKRLLCGLRQRVREPVSEVQARGMIAFAVSAPRPSDSIADRLASGFYSILVSCRCYPGYRALLWPVINGNHDTCDNLLYLLGIKCPYPFQEEFSGHVSHIQKFGDECGI